MPQRLDFVSISIDLDALKKWGETGCKGDAIVQDTDGNTWRMKVMRGMLHLISTVVRESGGGKAAPAEAATYR